MYLVSTMALSLELKKITFFVFAMLVAEVRGVRLREPTAARTVRLPEANPPPSEFVVVGAGAAR